ncbi:zinc finger and SCAN domain-containing protein 21-like [Cottoperca gobio]|uniref:Zinc finger and SCAN domain-containing protein 21-like n=1 Tax=Cottoperca gobio TaxID=56716 RepID=A0A6J2QNQ5_COTGO|nr:zinc finger and SCAN domain-containing protein 21-like [Cottoperca gobio]XP_029298961.1 zinc finger and SCAN domain-containing protein 21-like [Cottoperca gobio]
MTEMTEMQLLRLFISERLSAAAEEIFAAVQRTVTEREEEAARPHQDGDQHGLNLEVHSHSGDTPQVFVCAHEHKHEWSPESYHNNPSVGQEDCVLLVPEPPEIKQEEPWSSPEGQQLPDMEDCETSNLKVTPTCVYADMTEFQTHDTGNEDKKPVPNTSSDYRKIDGNAQSCSECWTLLPDCSVTLSNLGPELDLATLAGYSISNAHTKSPTGRNQLTKGCESHSPTSPNKETKRISKSYCCRFCGKEFSQSTHLATHTQIHTGEKLFACEVCGKEFRHGNSLTVHMRIHSEEKPYRCRICGKEFRHVGNLNVHTRIHTGEKPYTCTVCGKKFSRNNLMTKHMAVHTGEMSLGLKSVLRRGSFGMTS